VAPTACSWLANKNILLLFSEAEPLLYYFLDKYVTRIMVGGAKAMGKYYYKANKSKTLLDKLTVSDIAYSMLVYENAYDVWMEDSQAVMCETETTRRGHSNMLLSISTMYSEELVLLCITMD
jgi:hypothetical protein